MSDTVASGTLARVADWVLHHRRLVTAFWIVAFLAGAAGASHVSNRLTVDFSLPGQPGYETAKQIVHDYGNGGLTDPSLVTVTGPTGAGLDDQAVAGAFDRLRAARPDLRVVDFDVLRVAQARSHTHRMHALQALCRDSAEPLGERHDDPLWTAHVGHEPTVSDK